MKFLKRREAALVAVASGLTFIFAAVVTACIASTPASVAVKKPPAIAPAPNLVVGYARKHPDPAISGPFADKLESGEIKIVIAKPNEHAMASFGPHGGVYVLTVDPDRLKAEPTLEEYEGILSILSHEHAHYRQYVEGEMANYLPHDGKKMSEAQCTLTLLVEIDAHGKACRDAKAYGWETSVAAAACDRTTVSLAEYFLSERLDNYPECKPVWDFYAGHVTEKSSPKPKSSRVGPPKRRSSPVYMPPP